MDVKEFQNLVTNKFMPDFDYINYKFTFQTVFYISDYVYCCCTCGYEHEYLDYISESGEIDKEIHEKVVKCIIDGKCPHVDNVPYEYQKEAGIYGINIAAAVGTTQALKDLHYQYSHSRGCRRSFLFHLGPFEMALIKNQHVASMPVMEHYANSYSFQLRKHIAVQRLSKDTAQMKLEFATNLEVCIKMRNIHLVKSCLRFDSLGSHPAAALHLTCKYKKECKSIQKVLMKDYKRWRDLDFTYLAKCCKIAIIYNDSKLLGKILKFVPNHTKRWFEWLYMICHVLQQKKCATILKRHNIPMLFDMSPSEQVHSLLSLLDYSHVRDKVTTALNQIPKLSGGFNSIGDFNGSFLHYYIHKLTGNKSDYYRDHNYTSTGHNYCQVLKSIIDFEPNSINCRDGNGMTPLMYLLSRSVNILPLVRQIAEILIYENPDLEQEQTTVIYGIKRDKQLNQQGTRVHRLSYLAYYSYIPDSFIPDVKAGFQMDAQEHGLFGHEDQESFAFNFFVPLLIESGFPVPTEVKSLLVSKKGSLHPAENAYIAHYLETPRLLTLCCRDTLRKHYTGRQVHGYVKKTNMPQNIRDFILLKALLKCTPEDLISRCTNFINWK